MYTFITSGTFDYLRNIVLKHADEKILFLQNFNQIVLVHESKHSTIFKEARKYEVIDAHGSFTDEGFAVMHNIPVTQEGRSVFEHVSKNISDSIKLQKGFIALRTLKPSKGETYIMLTEWINENAYRSYQDSTAFSEAEKLLQNDSPQKLFTGNAYVSKYNVVNVQE